VVSHAGPDTSANAAGSFQNIPVYAGPSESKPAADEFMVLSTRHAAQVKVYAASPEQPFRTFLVKDYSLEAATAVAQGDRSWLPEEARSLAPEALVDYLRERVSIRIEEAFEIIVRNPLATRILRVSQT
jgi:hypothetical protein